MARTPAYMRWRSSACVKRAYQNVCDCFGGGGGRGGCGVFHDIDFDADHHHAQHCSLDRDHDHDRCFRRLSSLPLRVCVRTQACANGQLACAQWVLSRRPALIDLGDDQDTTPLVYACRAVRVRVRARVHVRVRM
eukprot:2004970-Pleurochrysis_carterae.AAC.1